MITTDAYLMAASTARVDPNDPAAARTHLVQAPLAHRAVDVARHVDIAEELELPPVAYLLVVHARDRAFDAYRADSHRLDRREDVTQSSAARIRRAGLTGALDRPIPRP